jgi:membrane associated rhomboid family serine protease
VAAIGTRAEGEAVGWQERDYSDESYHDPVSTAWGIRRPPNGVLALLILHGVAFLLMLALQRGDGEAVAALFVLSGGAAQPLGILLHPLGTASVLSALFVILALWSLGGRLAPRVGLRRLVVLYVAGNLTAGVAYWGVARGWPTLAGAPLDYPVGALAAWCALAWTRLRDDAVQILGRVTSAAKVYAICGAIVVGLAALDARLGVVAWLAGVLAGGLCAFVLERGPGLPKLRPRTWRRVVRPSIPRSVLQPPPDEPDIDDLLAKISQEGLGSLTAAERRRLEAARRAKLRRSH